MGISDTSSMDSGGEDCDPEGNRTFRPSPTRSRSKRDRDNPSRFSVGSDEESQRLKTRRSEFVVIVKLKSNAPKTLNAVHLAESLSKEMGGFQHAKSLANGRILVVCNSKTQQEKALSISSLRNCDVEVYVPGTGTRAKGVIYGVPIDITDEEIRNNSMGTKIVEVRRFLITRNNEKMPSRTVLLTFDSAVMPSRVGIGFLSFQVKPYIRPPLRCFHCQGYGHVASVCRSKRKCGKCGGDHKYEECDAASMCCPNCGENHSSAYKGCRMYATAVEVQKVRTIDKISYAEAVRRVKNAGPGRLPQQPPAPRAQVTSTPSDNFVIKKMDLLAFISDVISELKFSRVVNKSDVVQLVSKAAIKYLQVNILPESLFRFLKERDGRPMMSQSSTMGGNR